ncbi:unnamed protein product, partial [marine sediment metagenome]
MRNGLVDELDRVVAQREPPVVLLYAGDVTKTSHSCIAILLVASNSP